MRFIRKHLNIIIIITVFIIISMVIILKIMLVKASSIEETLNPEIEIAEEEFKEETEDKKEQSITKYVKVDIKGEVNKPGVYTLEEKSRVVDQTTPNMIQGLKGIFAIKPLISREI